MNSHYIRCFNTDIKEKQQRSLSKQFHLLFNRVILCAPYNNNQCGKYVSYHIVLPEMIFLHNFAY